MKSDLVIRPAVSNDVPVILNFIRELAHFEKLSHEVSATEELLHENLFRTSRGAEAIVAEIAGRPVGFAIFFHNFSTFLGRPGLYLEDLFVREEHRSQGIGLEILKYLAALARERACGRLEWWVLDWNERAREFYRRLGAEPMNDWTVFRLNGEALKNLGDYSAT